MSGILSVLAGNNAAAGGGSYDAATTAWINAVVADGGSVGTPQKGYIDTLILGLKTDGLFTILDRLWLYASESTHQAKIDIISLASGTPGGATPPTFVANSGYHNTGTGWIDTGFNPAGGGTNYLQDSASLGGYVLTNRTTIAGMAVIGAFNSGHIVQLYALSAFSTASMSLNQASTSTLDTNQNSAWGFIVGTRTGASANALYQYQSGGNTSGTGSTVSSTPPSENFYALGRNNTGTGDSTSTDTHAAIFIGGGLTSTQAGNLSTRVNAYMTSWGINVY